jgi:hypothetical protein
LDVKSAAHGHGERLIISLGDKAGRPLVGPLGFFHVALDRGSRRIVLDLSHVNQTAIEPRQLKRILETSKMIVESDLTMDPQDGSTNMTLNLRLPVRIEVQPERLNPGQLVIDLQPLSLKVSSSEPSDLKMSEVGNE